MSEYGIDISQPWWCSLTYSIIVCMSSDISVVCCYVSLIMSVIIWNTLPSVYVVMVSLDVSCPVICVLFSLGGFW